ncbi:MAG: hydantoinase B/oxoprolinase family protein, partial [Candidatus Bathyarchaeia archaeon]
FRSPPVRVYVDDKDNEEFFKIYLANVRTPKYSYGDLKAQIGSLYRGEKRIRELIDRYGLEVFRQACEDVKNASEYAMRRTIAAIPDGEYEFESHLEDDGVIPNKKWKIKITTAIRGDEIIFDYTGSDPQCAGQLNMSFPCVASVSYTALMFITDPSIPRNEGCYRPVTIIAPPHSIVNCSYPAACIGGNTDTYPTATDTVVASLSNVIPERTAAAHGGTCGCIGMGGVNPETEEPFAYLPIEGMGWGARPWHDGDDAICVVNGNTCPNTPVEVLEVRYPIRINAYELHENSGGPGKYRGGLGIRRIFEYLSPVTISAHTNRHIEKPWGLMGGKPGANTALKVKTAGTTEFKSVVELFNRVSPGKFSGVELSEGDQILYESPGGGGWENPVERDPESVLKDVVEGVVSLESAKKDYGVQIDEKNFKLDYEATEKLRRGLIGKI